MPRARVSDRRTIERLRRALQASWSKKTCYPGDQRRWKEDDPAIGQCAVTSLVVQDVLGGDLLFCARYNHFWNKLPDGKEVDLTRSQFPPDAHIQIDRAVPREEVLYGNRAEKALTLERYLLLKNEVIRYLQSKGAPSHGKKISEDALVDIIQCDEGVHSRRS